MATTIKLKNGSGAPLAGDLVQGEPAFDLTNKRLYTENSGGSVIEVGTNPGTDVTFADNRKAIFGAGSDLQIYHDGSHSYIDEQGTGRLYINSGNGVWFGNADGSEIQAKINVDAACEFRYDNAVKLATTSAGIDVTGTVTANDLALSDSTPKINLYDTDGDGRLNIVQLGGISYLQTFGDGGFGTFILNSLSGATSKEIIRADNTNIQFKTDATLRGRFLSNGDYVLYNDAGTSTDFYWDASTSQLGIGTTSPDANLEIRKDNASGLGAVLSLTNSNTSGLTGNSVAIGLSAYAHTTIDSASYRGAIIRGETTAAGNGHSILFETSNTSAVPAERVRIDHDGNVGIGTASINRRLHVLSDQGVTSEFETSLSTGAYAAFVDATSVTPPRLGSEGDDFRIQTGNLDRLRIDSSGNVGIGGSPATFDLELRRTTGAAQFGLVSSATSVGDVLFGDVDDNNIGRVRYDHSDDSMQFQTNNAERMRIDASGRVGIGTDSPDSNIVSGIDNQSFVVARYDLSGGVPSGGLGGIYSANANAGGFSSGDVVIQARAGVNSRSLLFYTGNTSTERMRVDDSGNLLVGNTVSPLSLATGNGHMLTLSGYYGVARDASGSGIYINKTDYTSGNTDLMQFRTNGSVVGDLNYDGTDVLIVQVSDERLKNNIADSASAGSIIDAMQVRSFDWNDGAHVDYGFVAQELNQAYEPATKVGGDDVDEEPWGIKTQKLIPLLVKEIQDLRARVAQLEGE